MSKLQRLEALALAVRSGQLTRRDFIKEACALGMGLSAASAFLAACAKGDKGESADNASTAATNAASGETGLEKELNIYNWSDYIAENTIPDFEKEFGVKVTYDVFENNEEMLAKIQAGATGYDIVVPTDYMVTIMIEQGMLSELDPAALPNKKNLDPLFVDPPYDPGNKHSVAYQWGTTGYAWRGDQIKQTADSWALLFDPSLKGKMTMLDDSREVINAALKYLGYSLNTKSETELAEAKKMLIEQKKLLKAYVSAPVKASLISGDVWVAQLWSGDTFQAQAENDQIKYTIPKEGCTIWTDNLCVLASAPHKRAANAFINYVLRPEVGAAISNFVAYGSPNAAAMPLVDPAARENPAIYPPPDVLARLEFLRDLGEATRIWDETWTEIKAA
jgi:spermidine/putrescine transport system substrate-binding protein